MMGLLIGGSGVKNKGKLVGMTNIVSQQKNIKLISTKQLE